MSHAITMIGNTAQAAYAETKAWHGLGQILRRGASLEEWAQAAGFDWEVKRAFVRYLTGPEGQPGSNLLVDKDNVVLFASDTKQRVGIVSDTYKIVQPSEHLEFFREWIEAGGATMESAAWLHNRTRCFALARIGDEVALGANGTDRIIPYVRVSGSVDGSTATEAGGTSLRVECANMLQLSLAQDKSVYRCSHRSKFQPAEARAAVESQIKAFGAFVEAARTLARRKVAAAEADAFVRSVLASQPAVVADDVADKARASAGYKKVLALFNGEGGGSALATARGTAWGLLNAVTDYVDHSIRATSDDQRLNSAMFGAGSQIKARAAQAALAMVA